MRRFLTPTLLACGLAAAVAVPAASLAADQRSSGRQSVVVVVEVPRPWYAPDFLIVRKMRDAMPNYRSIPGLRYKTFTLAKPSGDFGGIYLWRDRASADAWFTSAWYQRVRDERGVEAKVRMFAAEGVFERKVQATRAEQEDDAVATLVSMPETIDRAAWAAQSPQERAAPGLLHLYEILMPDGGVGRVYLWRDNGAAEQWFGTAWRARMRTLAQRDARIEWFDAPILLPAAFPAAAKKAAITSGGAAR